MRIVNALFALAVALSACGAERPPNGDAPDMAGVIDDPQFSQCATGVQATDPQALYLMFVLDGSGSMSTDGKWDAVTSALGTVFDDFGAKADPLLGAGLIVYADSLDPTGDMNGMPGYGPYPTSADVPARFVDPAQLGKLKARLAGMPKGTTPTLPALQGGFQFLRSFAAATPLKAGGKKVVVLLTDGFPFSAIDSDTQVMQSISTTGMMRTLAAPEGPISTFSVGIGYFPSPDLVEYDPTFCGRIAEAGGTRASASCNPNENSDVSKVCHFQISPGAKPTADLAIDFLVALRKIQSAATDCEFLIKVPAGGSIDPAKTNVQYKPEGGVKKTIGKSDQNGWSFDNPAAPTRVRLNGMACEEYRVSKGTVDVIIGCSTIVL